MLILNMQFSTLASAIRPQDIPDFMEELTARLRYQIRTEEEVNENNERARQAEEARRQCGVLQRQLEDAREQLKDMRERHGKAVGEKEQLEARVNELVRANCPAPVLGESEKKMVRDGNPVLAIKTLRMRIEEEHKYKLGLKEAKDLVDAYKEELLKVESGPPPVIVDAAGVPANPVF